jgi:hypothetical protein
MPAIERRVLNPLAKRVVMPRRPPDTKTKVTSVRIHKARTVSSIPTMTMNQRQLVFTHLSSLLDNHGKSSIEYDFIRMVAVKVNLHLQPLGFFRFRANRAPAGAKKRAAN